MKGHFLPSVFAASDISVAGPLARSAADLEIAMEILAGPEGIDAEGYRYRLKHPRGRRLSEFRVSVMLSDPMSEVDQPVQDLFSALARFLEPRVASLSMTARPEFTTSEAMDIYIALLRAATSRRQTDAEFLANSAAVKNLVAGDCSYFARMLRAQTMPHRDWLAVNHRRHDLRQRWHRFFRSYDVLLCPTAASAAFPHDHEGERHERTIMVNGNRVPATDQLFWAGYSGAFFLPSTVAPIGLTADGLPVGVQIITAEHDDMTAIRFAAMLEREYYAFTPPPGYP
jgi:amidase